LEGERSYNFAGASWFFPTKGGFLLDDQILPPGSHLWDQKVETRDPLS
jgi:hypothetical protein